MKFLLIGAGGQLGQALRGTLPRLGEVRALGRAELDLSLPLEAMARLRHLCEAFLPDVVVNAAAFTSVDKAESEPELALAVNAQSVAEIAKFATHCGALLVHYSTDYVFDGLAHAPWREDDAPHPLSIYGHSKWLGEKAAAQHCPRHLILRTSWVVSAQGSNFLKTILRLAGERESLRVVADQVGAPTCTELISRATIRALGALAGAGEGDARWGTYHLAASGETSWCEYARHVVAGAWSRGAQLRLRPECIEAITTAQYPLPAPRPLNSRLDTQKFRRTFDMPLADWREGVDDVLDHLIPRTRT